MPAFKVTYSDGTVATMHKSDCSTVEQAVNSIFGSSFNPDTCKVEFADQEVEAVQEPVVEKKKKSAPLFGKNAS